MNEFELFSLIYIALDEYYDSETCDNDINTFISGLSPFTFTNIGSADPCEYKKYQKFINGRKITIDNSLEIAKEYIKQIDYVDVREPFEVMTEQEWKSACNTYLSEPHKGMDL